jgi:tetratricopeptide (TPR) repeat protein
MSFNKKKIILFIALVIVLCSCHRKPVYIPDEPVRYTEDYKTPKAKPEPIKQPEISKEDPCQGLTKLECQLKKIEELVQIGLRDLAIKKLNSLVEGYPHSDEVRILLGKCYLKDKQFEKARFNFEKALELNLWNQEAVMLLKELQQTKWSIPDAISLWVYVKNHKIQQHSLLTNFKGGLKVKSVRKVRGIVTITIQSIQLPKVEYELRLPYLPRGEHILIAKRKPY